VTADLVAFLNARLDEDEEMARRWSTDEHRWQHVGRRCLTYDNGYREEVAAIDVSNQPALWWERIYIKRDIDGLAAHIARHDPARVLADVQAKRAILAMHEPGLEPVGDDEEWVCQTCNWPTGGPDGGCKTVLLLANAYADHPDFDPKWKLDN